jgi:hypothetical protein
VNDEAMTTGGERGELIYLSVWTRSDLDSETIIYIKEYKK